MSNGSSIRNGRDYSDAGDDFVRLPSFEVFSSGIKHEQTIEVKGYAEKDVVSDVGKFSSLDRARSGTLKESYEAPGDKPACFFAC